MNDSYPVEARRWNGDTNVPINLTEEQMAIIGEMQAVAVALGLSALD